jgi:hypothetical protein
MKSSIFKSSLKKERSSLSSLEDSLSLSLSLSSRNAVLMAVSSIRVSEDPNCRGNPNPSPNPKGFGEFGASERERVPVRDLGINNRQIFNS